MTQVNTESNQVQGALGDAVSVEAGQHSRDVSHHESPQLVGSPPHSSVNHQEQIADADHSHPEGNGAKKNPFGRQLNPSWKVVFNIDNAMVGTALLVLPLHFQWAGFIVSFIAAVIGTTIAFVTTHLVVIHHKKGEKDMSQQLSRIIGRGWGKGFLLSAFITLYGYGVSYFLLITNIAYTMVDILVSKDLPPRKDGIRFDVWSFQWTSFFFFFILLAMYNIKNNRIIMKLSSYGFVANIMYLVFIVYLGIHDLASGDVYWSSNDVDQEGGKGIWEIGTWNQVATLVSLYSLIFGVHTVLIRQVRHNKKLENNRRDTRYAVLVAAILYFTLGVFGAFGVGSRPACFANANPATVMSCLKNSSGEIEILTVIAILLLCVGMISVMPLYERTTRNQFFTLLGRDPQKISNKSFFLYNLVYVSFDLLLAIANVNPSKALSLIGAVLGFFNVFLFPIRSHFRAKRRGLSEDSNETAEESQQKSKDKENASNRDTAADNNNKEGETGRNSASSKGKNADIEKISPKSKNSYTNTALTLPFIESSDSDSSSECEPPFKEVPLNLGTKIYGERAADRVAKRRGVIQTKENTNDAGDKKDSPKENEQAVHPTETYPTLQTENPINNQKTLTHVVNLESKSQNQGQLEPAIIDVNVRRAHQHKSQSQDNASTDADDDSDDEGIIYLIKEQYTFKQIFKKIGQELKYAPKGFKSNPIKMWKKIGYLLILIYGFALLWVQVINVISSI